MSYVNVFLFIGKKIVLKKNKLGGFNGNFTSSVGYGRFPKFTNSIALAPSEIDFTIKPSFSKIKDSASMINGSSSMIVIVFFTSFSPKDVKHYPNLNQ